MKAAFYFAIREIRRRQRHFLALTVVSAAILTTLIMMLMLLNAEWRNDVMPERPDNYHFTIKGISESEKKWIRSQPWVQVCYDVERYVSNGVTADDTLNVRLIWSENYYSTKRAWEIFDEFNLWEREPYKLYYESQLDEIINKYKKDYATSDLNYRIAKNETLLQRATNLSKHQFLMSRRVKNIGYCQDVIDSYIIRPKFFVLTIMFALFLGGVMMILQSENYRALMPEYGALRSFGLKRRQIWYINGIESLASSIMSIPLGTVLSLIIVKIYMLANADILADDSVYLKLTENIPAAVIIFMSLELVLVSLLGSILVCLHYDKRSTMELLKREGSVQVSFVAKTSPKFDRAKSVRIYSVLQRRRTRVSFILSIAVIVIMMPLPLSFLGMSSTILINPTLSASELAEGYYYLFQALVLFVTSVIVIYIASRSRSDDRHGEFAILRSLGMKKRQLRRTAFPSVIYQILMTVIPAELLFLKLTDMSYVTVSENLVRHLTMSEFFVKMLTDSAGVILLIAPPMLLGLALSLVRFNRRSIIESIRENE